MNDCGQILFVKEKKEPVLNKLNLPGGHLELGEALVEGAKREALEEVHVEVEILGLVGIYTGRGDDHYLHFIFSGSIKKGIPSANKHQVNDIGWYTLEELQNMPEDQMLNARKLKKILSDYGSGKMIPLEAIREMD